MAIRPTFRFDRDGVVEILADPALQSLLQGHANNIAASVESSHHPRNGTAVDTYSAYDGTGARSIRDRRQLWSVTVKDRRALTWQAADGMLTKAASAEGLEVKARA